MKRLKIKKAYYYDPDKIAPKYGTNVRRELSSLIKENKIIYNGIYNNIFPDKYNRTKKRLYVLLRYGFKKYEKFYNENDLIDLPRDLRTFTDKGFDVNNPILVAIFVTIVAGIILLIIEYNFFPQSKSFYKQSADTSGSFNSPVTQIQDVNIFGNQDRQVDSILLDEIIKCSNQENKYKVIAVVNSNGLTGNAYDETENFAGHIIEGLKSREVIIFEQSSYIYEASAVIPDGVMVFASTTMNMVYVGRNSNSGKSVVCLDHELKLGYAGFNLKNYTLDINENGGFVAEFNAAIIEENPTSNVIYIMGAEKYSDGKWRPALKIKENI